MASTDVHFRDDGNSSEAPLMEPPYLKKRPVDDGPGAHLNFFCDTRGPISCFVAVRGGRKSLEFKAHPVDPPHERHQYHEIAQREYNAKTASCHIIQYRKCANYILSSSTCYSLLNAMEECRRPIFHEHYG
ncbi:hypothetical protein CVS40_5349 [Lucilia cuprina]|nr:hypothetical protein CVS40_5349 [Lucilia cuprina]